MSQLLQKIGNMSLGNRNKISTLLSWVALATITISVKGRVQIWTYPIQLAYRTWLVIDFLDWKLKLNQQQLLILDFFFFILTSYTLCRVLFSILVSEKCTAFTRTSTLKSYQRQEEMIQYEHMHTQKFCVSVGIFHWKKFWDFKGPWVDDSL